MEEQSISTEPDSAELAGSELAASLSGYLSTQAGHPVAVSGCRRISSGWESDVFAFDAPSWQPGGHVLRLYFGANAAETALHEFRSLELLNRAGYPVPRVDLVEPSTLSLGRAFLIMQRIEGISLGRQMREAGPVQQTEEWERFSNLQVSLHTLAWQHLPGAEFVRSVSIAQQLAYWRSFGERFGGDAVPPAALAWLEETSVAVTPMPLGLVHWDFHHENILVDKENRAWVIDWTQFQATDVRFDLAWTIVLLSSEHEQESGQRARAGYYAQAGWDGAAVEADMRFFEAAAIAKRLFSVLISLQSGADAVGMRPGAETIMTGRFPRFAQIYRRWLALTATPLPSVESMLDGYL